MDQRVRVLVEEYGVGRLSRRGFLDGTARIVGAGAAASLLVACSGDQPDNLAASPAVEGQSPTAVGAAVEAQLIEYAVEGGVAPGFVARPSGGGPFPGVVVIQEWWGLDEHIKDVTRRVAMEGFVALAPDLYRGEVAREPSDARRLAMALVREQALADIQGAADYLASLPTVAPKQIGVMGFCMGGALAMQMAYKGREIGASVVFYGGGVQPTDDELRAISAPILGLYGEADGGIPVELVREWGAKLAAFGKTGEMVIYPDAPHAFFNDTRASYRAEAAADAWRRTIGWFRTHLGHVDGSA